MTVLAGVMGLSHVGSCSRPHLDAVSGLAPNASEPQNPEHQILQIREEGRNPKAPKSRDPTVSLKAESKNQNTDLEFEGQEARIRFMSGSSRRNRAWTRAAAKKPNGLPCPAYRYLLTGWNKTRAYMFSSPPPPPLRPNRPFTCQRCCFAVGQWKPRPRPNIVRGVWIMANDSSKVVRN